MLLEDFIKTSLGLFVKFAISLSLVLGPIGAHSQLSPDPESFFSLPHTSYGQDPAQMSDAEQAALEALFKQPVQVTIELMALLRALLERTKQLENEFGEEELLKRVTSRKRKFEVVVEIPGVGKAEMNTLGLHDRGRVFTRIVHYGTQKAYLFLDASQIQLDYLQSHELSGMNEAEQKQENRLRRYLAEQLRGYIARQNIVRRETKWEYMPLSEQVKRMNGKSDDVEIEFDPKEVQKSNSQLEKVWENLLMTPEEANPNRIDGRDVVTVWYDGREVVKINETQKPKSKLSFEYWKTYWWSVYERPNFNEKYLNEPGAKKIKAYLTGDWALAWGSAVAQAGVALGLSGLMVLTQGAEFTFTPAILSLIWGSILGVYTKTYRNWVYRGPHHVQTMKSWLVSMSFSYTLTVMTLGMDSVLALTVPALLMSVHLFANNLANNWAKTWYYQFSRLREHAGENLKEVNIPGEYEIKWPGGGKTKIKFGNTLETKIDQAGLEMQVAYLPNYFFKLADMTNWQVTVPLIGALPIGKILLWGSIPVVRYKVVRFAEKHQYPEAQKLRQDWEADKMLGVPYLGVIVQQGPIAILQLSAFLIRPPLRLAMSITEAGKREVARVKEKVRSRYYNEFQPRPLPHIPICRILLGAS